MMNMYQAKNFTIVDCEQRSTEWYSSRAGRVTGSKADVIFTGEKTAGYQDYLTELALGRINGFVDKDGYVSSEMQRGIDKEPDIMMACELRFNTMIRQTGFIQHNSLPIGVSLDGDSDDFGVLYEFKAPKSKTHLRYLRENIFPKDYIWQCTHALYTIGSDELVFASFDDRVPKVIQLFTKEVRASDMPMEEYDKQLMKFLGDVLAVENKIRELIEVK